MDRRVPLARRFLRASDGAAAVEFAIVGPALAVMLLGICGWGGYFWLSHSVQQLTNDAARAAMGGLDTAERASLAQAAVTEEISDYTWLTAANSKVVVTDAGDSLTVKITYDASGTPFWSMSGLVPMPSKTISRSATVRLGGY